MSDDVLITPGSRKMEFKDSSANIDAKIETDASGNLKITNAGGDIEIGDTSSDVFIGDGTNNIDIVFEQSGEIRGTSGVTLTLGASGSNVAMATDLSLGGNDLTNVGNLTMSGNLTVSGTTTTVSSTNTTIADSIIELNSGLTGANTKDIGFIFERGSTGNNAGFVWDESADRFTVFTTTDTASSDTVNTGTVANFQAGSFYGNGANLTSLNASNLGSGTIPTARIGVVDLGSGTNSVKKTAGGSSGNHAAIEVFGSGTGDEGAAIAIQQQTSEGDTIIFADYEPHVEWGISAENSSNEIHFNAGSSTNSLGTRTFRNNAGDARTAYKKVVIALSSGNIQWGGTATGNGSGITTLNGSNISSGTVAAARIANLAASKITSGTFDAARIPTLNQNTSGTAGGLSGTPNISVGTISSGDITISDASPLFKLTDSTNGGGGAAEGKILFSNSGGDALGIGYTGNVETNSDFLISSDSGGTFGGHLGLDSGAITDARSHIILEPKTNLMLANGGTNGGAVFQIGLPGNGTNVNGCFFSIEGNTDTSGEGSGRLMFREHNSSTASADNYGLSLGYRGGSTSVTTAMGNTWTGLSQIGNGQWGMWGHDGSATGALVMYGDRAATFVNFAGNAIQNASIAASLVNSGTLQDARIPNLAASKITSGTFADARIAASSITQHTDSKYLRSNATDTATGLITLGNGVIITKASSDQSTSQDSASVPDTTGAEIVKFQGGYTNGQYTTEFAKVDRSGNLPLYVRQSKGTANSFSNIARFGDHGQSNGTDVFAVFGNARVNGTTTSQNLTLSNLSAQNSEATSLMINGSGVVGTRELGSNAFNSTTIPTNNNQLTNGAGYITSLSFNGLSSKGQGTGEYSTNSHLTSGRGSGGVSLTINDGYGNANITFNHKSGVPEQNGQAARIEVNTDGTSTEGIMSFELSSADVTSGSAVNLVEAMILAHDYMEIPYRLRHKGDTNTYMQFDADRIQFVAGGTTKLDTNNTYLTSHQDISHLAPKASPTFTGDITIPDQIIHTGDSNTYLQFHANDQFRVVAGGNEVTEWRSDRMQMNNKAITWPTWTTFGETALSGFAYNALNAPIHISAQNVGTTDTYLPFLQGSALHSAGYRTSYVLGGFKQATSGAGWGNGFSGFFMAMGGNDNNPTTEFRFSWDGHIWHTTGGDGTYMDLGNTSNQIQFRTNGTERFRFDTAGGSFMAGNELTFFTSGGSERGFLKATDTNDEHFIIATSGGEDIAFKDGGLSGTTNLISRGDGNLWVRGSILNGTIAYSQVTGTPTIPTNNNQLTNGASYITASNAAITNKMPLSGGTFSGAVTVNANMDFSSTDTAARYIHMPRGGGITLYGDTSVHHGLFSRAQNNGAADDILISSYGALYIDLDSNSNNDNNADFVIGKHNSTGLNLFAVSGENGTISQNNKNIISSSGTSLVIGDVAENDDFDSVKITSMSGTASVDVQDAEVYVAGGLNIQQYLRHTGDTNTHLQFTGDRVRLTAGNVEMIDCVEGGTDYVDIIDRVRVTSGGDMICEGDVVAFTSTTVSDINQKENIKPIKDAVSKVKRLAGVTFDWKKDKVKSAGIIAQDVEKVLPEIVKQKEDRSGEEFKSVDYNGIIGLLVEGMKEQQEEIEKLKKLLEDK